MPEPCPRSEGKGDKGKSPLGKPFDVIFTSAAEAQAAFDLVRWTLIALGVSQTDYEKDNRIALTLRMPQPPPRMRLNFGNWCILTFFRPKHGEQRVQFLCRKDLIPEAAKYDPEGFAELIDDQAFTLVSVEVSRMQADGSPEKAAFETSLGQARKRFADWGGSPWKEMHRPELLRMAFDEVQRDRL